MMVAVDSNVYARLLAVLESSLVPDTATQQNVGLFLDEFDKSHSDASAYFLEASLSAPSPYVRQMAALMLKKAINNKKVTTEVLPLLKQGVLKALMSGELTTAYSSCFAALVRVLGFTNWPEGLEFLFSNLDTNPKAVGNALVLVVEDCMHSKDEDFERFLVHQLLPKIFTISNAAAIPSCCRILILLLDCTVGRRLLLRDQFACFWDMLGRLGNSDDPDVCKLVARSMSAIFTYHPKQLLAASDAVFRYICKLTDHADSSVQLEAMDFWSTILKHREDYELYQQVTSVISPIVPVLFETLLGHVRYTDWDYMSMDETHFQNDNADIPDKIEDLQPCGSARTSGQQGSGDDGGGGADADGDGTNTALSDTECDGAAEVSSNTWGNVWTVRKGAALAIDNLAHAFGNKSDFVKLGVNLIEKRFASNDWEDQESAVLALGAIAPGTWRFLDPMLPRVLPRILQLTRHEQPLMRSIAVWCCCRFSFWIASDRNASEWIPRLFEVLNACILDRNKRVQEATCSALAIFIEDVDVNLGPSLGPLLATLSTACDFYKVRNSMILYDAISTLFDSQGTYLTIGGQCFSLLDKIVSVGLKLETNTPQLLALVECWNRIVNVIGSDFERFAPVALRRCTTAIIEVLNDVAMIEAGLLSICPNWTIFEVSTDFISAVAQSMGTVVIIPLSSVWHVVLKDTVPQLAGQLKMTQCDLDALLVHGAMQSKSSAVIQAVLAAIGHVCWVSPHLIRCPQVLVLIAGSLVDVTCSVANNAAWALGNFASQPMFAQYLFPYYDSFCRGLVHLLQRWGQQRMLVQNALVTLAKLANLNPQGMLPLATLILPVWGEKLVAILPFGADDVDVVACIESLLNVLAMDPIHLQLVPAVLIQSLQHHRNLTIQSKARNLLARQG